MEIWRIIDGRPGHDHQSSGLVKALGELCKVSSHDLDAKRLKWPLYHLLARSFPPGNALPHPDLILGAGHSTHLPVLCAQRAHGGRSVILMRPGLPARWFNYCLIPEHDHCPSGANIIRTRGAISTIRPGGAHLPHKGLILVGGPSRHYDWDEKGMLNQIGAIISRNDHITWTISDSPRTPDTTRSALNKACFTNAVCHHWRNTSGDWIETELAQAGQAWVSADSVSMVHEAITAGARTGILSVPEKRPGKLARALESLIEDGLVTPFPVWQQTGELRAPRAALDEARRCALLLLGFTGAMPRDA